MKLYQCGLVILNYKDSIRSLDLAQKAISFKNVSIIVIIDNDSQDGSYEYLCSNNDNKNIIIIKSDKNGGFASGTNIGINYLLKNYSFDYICCANPDTIWDESLIDECILKLEEDKILGLVSSRIKGINGEEHLSFWSFPTFLDSCFINFWFYNKYKYEKRKKINYNSKFQYVDVVRGSFMFFRTKSLIESGLFDENTFLYCEEDIISKKLITNGYRVGILTDLFYIHDHIEYNKPSSYVKTYNKLRKSRYYYLKTYCNINIIKKLFLKFFNLVGVIENAFISMLLYVRRSKKK